MTGLATQRRSAQSGYALLALLASSAILLAGLALALPRMAMQAQRVKDERLIERGEQYKRAIELYYRDHNKYPEELDDLEDTDGVRYLRRRSTDPMGDSGDWRIIHMGTDGRFEDSLLYDLSKPNARAGFGSLGSFGNEAESGEPDGLLVSTRADNAHLPQGASQNPFQDPRPALGLQPLAGPGRARLARESAAPDLADRTRYSQGFQFDANQDQRRDELDGTEEDGYPDYSRMLPSDVPMNENDPGADGPFGSGMADDGGTRGFPSAPPGYGQGPGGLAPGTAGTASPVSGSPQGVSAGPGARGLINRILTSPRTGGLAGAAQSGAVAAQRFQRGIAGVASMSEEVGVKVYNGKEAYNEWEFVYDYRKDAETKSTAGQNQRSSTSEPPQRDLGRSLRGRSSR